ncbi:50S ribosomal protein L1 [bacterium]|nr:MAG: 50S ribosomal protein L1 [bacterium]
MSKRIQELRGKFNEDVASVEDAIKLIKENANAKFDESVEVHVRLGIDLKKPDQKVRASVDLPHGTGKTKVVAVFTSTKQDEAKEGGADIIGADELIEEIKKSGKIACESIIATSEMMPKLAKIAKILGPKGLMPSPKSGTVTDNIKDTIKAIKAGKVEFRSDDSGSTHAPLGKISFDNSKLEENYSAFIEALKKAKPESHKGTFIKSISLCSTMGVGIKVSSIKN